MSKKLSQIKAEKKLVGLGIKFNPFTYLRNTTKVEYHCPECDTLKVAQYNNLVSNVGVLCKSCASRKSQTISQEIAEQRIIDLGIEFKPFDYIGIRGKLTIKCVVCNEWREVVYQDILSSTNNCKMCSTCANRKNSLYSNYPMVLDWSNYKTKTDTLLCRCEVCGNSTQRTLKSIDRSGGHCYCEDCVKKLRVNNMKKTYEDKKPEISEKIKRTKYEKYGNENYNNIEKWKETNLTKFGVEYPLQSEIVCSNWKNNFNKKWGCDYPLQNEKIRNKSRQTSLEKHGVEYYSQLNRKPWQIEVTSCKDNLEKYLKSLDIKLTSSELAEKLGYKDIEMIRNLLNKWELYGLIDSYTSYGEKEIIEFINECGFSTIKKKYKWGEIDVFIPELNIGFEFNGCHWHNDIIKPKNYHYNKITNAISEGVRLIHIWDYEWMNNKEQIKSYIKAQLGLCEHRIFARNCEVREIDLKTVRPLLQYHQQKVTTAKHYIGLYHNDELVLVMLFGIPYHKDVAEYEVKREVCKEGYSVVGGKSKVFKYFVNKYSPETIVSYVDRSKFTGKSYEIMGFKLDHIVPGRYDWVYRNGLIFKKRSPSIYQEMKKLYQENKVYRVFDAGRYCFIWKK